MPDNFPNCLISITIQCSHLLPTDQTKRKSYPNSSRITRPSDLAMTYMNVMLWYLGVVSFIHYVGFRARHLDLMADKQGKHFHEVRGGIIDVLQIFLLTFQFCVICSGLGIAWSFFTKNHHVSCPIAHSLSHIDFHVSLSMLFTFSPLIWIFDYSIGLPISWCRLRRCRCLILQNFIQFFETMGLGLNLISDLLTGFFWVHFQVFKHPHEPCLFMHAMMHLQWCWWLTMVIPFSESNVLGVPHWHLLWQDCHQGMCQCHQSALRLLTVNNKHVTCMDQVCLNLTSHLVSLGSPRTHGWPPSA